jgi:branched-chain amino acid transport system substrate-binding protein
MRRVIAVIALVFVAGACAPLRSQEAIVVGAVYPTGGAQGPGGIEEFRGVQLAADYVNARGGVNGRPVKLHLERAERREQAPAAVDRLHAEGVKVVLGSYGSTISNPASHAAIRNGQFFWETGAVGELGMALAPEHGVFRYPNSGEVLGERAIAFVRDELHLGTGLRYTVAYADDVYGRSVGGGALAAIRKGAQRLAANLAYDPRTVNVRTLVDEIVEARTDVLVVAAYLEDGVALRREIVKRKVPLKVNIGTSSSYCMREFGKRLGADAVGLFASDKPNGAVPDGRTLRPAGTRALRWLRAQYARKFSDDVTAPVLTGFAAATGLFSYVLPKASGDDVAAITAAAQRVDVPRGELPDGGGLRFGSEGRNAGANRRATHVIWEWIAPRQREVVWPPEVASHAIVPPRP